MTAIDMIGQSQHMSFSDIQSCLHAKRDTLIALDPTFTLELNFLASSALQALQDHLHSEIFKVLPTSTRRATIQQARWVLSKRGLLPMQELRKTLPWRIHFSRQIFHFR